MFFLFFRFVDLGFINHREIAFERICPGLSDPAFIDTSRPSAFGAKHHHLVGGHGRGTGMGDPRNWQTAVR